MIRWTLLLSATAFADPSSDLANAERDARDAIAHSAKGAYLHDPNGRARADAYAQLGDVQVAQHKPKDAAQSYRSSLQSHPSRAVREKLQQLDPAIAGQMDPLAPKLLAGPYKDLTELCRAWFAKVGSDEHDSCKKPSIIKGSGKLAQAMRFDSGSYLELAIPTDEGWYAYEYEQKGDRGQEHCGATAFTVTPRAAKRAPELRIEYTSRNNQCAASVNGHTRTWGWDEKGVIAIHTGYSGKPSGTPPIVTSLVEWQRYGRDDKQQITDAAVTLAWANDGALDVTGNVMHPPHILSALEDGDLDAEQLIGHHVLAFP